MSPPPPSTPTPLTLSVRRAHRALEPSRIPLTLWERDPGLRPSGSLPTSLQPHPCLGVLARRSGSAGARSQLAAGSSAPSRVRNPWLGFWQGAMSVLIGRYWDLGSGALWGCENPRSERQPLLPPRIRGGKQCDRPELWARPQPPRPPPGRPHLQPAS
jgi:hypothetical protein